MRFSTWIAKQPPGTAARIQRESGLSQRTIDNLKADTYAQPQYATGLAIERATNGAVTVADVCTPPKLSTRAKPKYPRRGRPERVTTQRGHR